MCISTEVTHYYLLFQIVEMPIKATKETNKYFLEGILVLNNILHALPPKKQKKYLRKKILIRIVLCLNHNLPIQFHFRSIPKWGS